MTTAPDLLQTDAAVRLRRMALRAAADGAPIQDVIDCAEYARAAGEGDVADRLSGLAALELGAGPTGQHGFSVDLAIDELRGLMAIAPRLAEEELRFPPADTGPNQRPFPDPPAVAAITRQSDALLAAVPGLLAAGGLAAGLRALADDILSMPRIAPDEHVAADPATLASLLGLKRLRRFLIANAALLRAEREGPPLLDAAAKLSPAALGPYFTNVRMLIRNARDIFALIEAAGDRPSRGAVEAWSVLLSAHLHHHQLVELADELGDRGMTFALAQLLARAARAEGPRYPLDPVWRIRDVSLDLGEREIAANAQQLIALWRPYDPNEWRILAEIRTEMNDLGGADVALQHALMLRPDDPAMHKLVEASKAGGMPVRGGYGSSAGRRRLRQVRADAYRALA